MRLFETLLVLMLLLCPLVAQHVTVVQEESGVFPVVSVKGYKPFVLKDGKVVESRSRSYGLVETGEYLPIFVSVWKSKVGSSHSRLSGGAEINQTFELQCQLESAFDLEGLFMVLVLDTEAGKRIFLRGLDKLEARKPRYVDVSIPVGVSLGSGVYRMHLFVKGREVFSSMLPFGEMDIAERRMVSERIKDVQNASAKPFIDPAPEYPTEMYKKRVEGSAVLTFRITIDGSVEEPEVTEASQPEFGSAALAVIRQWRFLPKVVDGQPVESKASMPFAFTPPKK
jgi:TonB family protein